jgi:hypothetical protein
VEERIYQGMSEKTMQRFVDAGGYPLQSDPRAPSGPKFMVKGSAES